MEYLAAVMNTLVGATRSVTHPAVNNQLYSANWGCGIELVTRFAAAHNVKWRQVPSARVNVSIESFTMVQSCHFPTSAQSKISAFQRYLWYF